MFFKVVLDKEYINRNVMHFIFYNPKSTSKRASNKFISQCLPKLHFALFNQYALLLITIDKSKYQIG